MGVKNLWRILNPYGKKVSLENKILAVDTSIWMHQYKNMASEIITYSICKRIFKLLYNKVKPVFIFDGVPPIEKKETLEKRKKEQLKTLLRRYLLDKNCTECGKKLKDCEHLNDFDQDKLTLVNGEVLQKLRTHNYDWGEFSDDFDDLFSENTLLNSNKNNFNKSYKIGGKEVKHGSAMDIKLSSGKEFTFETSDNQEERTSAEYYTEKYKDRDLYEVLDDSESDKDIIDDISGNDGKLSKHDVFLIKNDCKLDRTVSAYDKEQEDSDKKALEEIMHKFLLKNKKYTDSIEEGIFRSSSDESNIPSYSTNNGPKETNYYSIKDFLEVSNIKDNGLDEFEEPQGFSKSEQMKRLNELRRRRKRPMSFDAKNEYTFSRSQIINVKKRNNLTTQIKNLNKKSAKTIQSDCMKSSMLTKNSTDWTFRSLNFVKEDQEVEKDEINEEVGIDDMFNLYQRNNDSSSIEKDFEMYVSDKAKKSKCIGDINNEAKKLIEDKIRLNEEILNEIALIRKQEIGIPDMQPRQIREEPKEEVKSEIKEESSEFDMKVVDECMNKIENEQPVSTNPIEKDIYTATYKSNTDIQKVKDIIVKILKVFKIPYIDSPSETDQQCGYLFRSRLIDGVITEDNDMIITGCTIYRNFFKKDKDIVEYSYSDVEAAGLDQTALINIAYLLGCDYCLGQKGIGVKKAIEKLSSVAPEEIDFLKKIYQSQDVKKVTEFNFGSAEAYQLRNFLKDTGLDDKKVDELMLYYKVVKEMENN